MHSACLLLAAVALALPTPKKVVILAGDLDASHPAGTHEYEKTARLLKHCLGTANNLNDLVIETHFHGWPRDAATLDTADAIVLISNGSDRKEQDHPLLVGDRRNVIAKQMQRGCGLVTIHWSTFFPNGAAGEQMLDWVGGHFDYQSGPPPRKWASAIQHVTAKLEPGTPGHPASRGVPVFSIRDEFYYQMRFRANDARLKPVAAATIPGVDRPQTVAWAVERGDGGRGFGFTGGHYFDNWWNDSFRKLVLNAIVWTAKAEVPPGGVASVLPEPKAFDVPAGDPAWTPPPVPGGKYAWERMTDADWSDDRLQKMNTGPALNATFAYAGPRGRTLCRAGTAVRLTDGAVIFDRAHLSYAAAWTGGYVEHGNRRFGLMNTPVPPATSQILATANGPGWADPNGSWGNAPPLSQPLPREWGRYRGLYRAAGREIFRYDVGGVEVHDSPQQFGRLLVRELTVAKSAKPLTLLAGELPGPAQAFNWNGLSAYMSPRPFALIALDGPGTLGLTSNNGVTVTLPPADAPRKLRVLLTNDFNAKRPADPVPDLAALAKPGPARWPAVSTRGSVGRADGPFAIDTITVPYDNPYKALFFVTGVDFLPDGRAAVCTAHGDVWLVSGLDDKLEKVTWQRFATGLYQPIGLRVRDDKVIVIERGQLTRLHDENGDGEADYYECVANGWDNAGGEHSYDTGLEIDRAGNFYFFKTGDTDTPTGGTLLKVSPDGAKTEIYSTGFRHPIGMGMSPRDEITGADQEGNWMPATRIDQYTKGGFYGDMRAHHRATPPQTYDPPLCWLPREVDNSAGGQVWVPDGMFGALSGRPLHLSYGRCKLFALLTETVDGTLQGGAADLGLTFLSGTMRGRFRPQDGHLYVVGLNGWQTAAERDGCLQRVRATGKPLQVPVDLHARPNGLLLTFTRPLDPAAVANVKNWKIERWNYRYGGDYGSKRWSVANPQQQGQDAVTVTAAKLSADGKTVELTTDALVPVMQQQVSYQVKTAEGKPLTGEVYHTIHKLSGAK